MQTFNAGLSSGNSYKTFKTCWWQLDKPILQNLLLHRNLAKQGIFQRRDEATKIEVWQIIKTRKMVPSCKAEISVRIKACQDGQKVECTSGYFWRNMHFQLVLPLFGAIGLGSDEGKWHPEILHLCSALDIISMQELNPQLRNINCEVHSTSADLLDDTVAKGFQDRIIQLINCHQKLSSECFILNPQANE